MIFYVVLLPLLGAILTGLNTTRMSKDFAAILTSSFVVISALLSGYIFYQVTMLGQIMPAPSLAWFDIGSFQANWSLKVDSLTAVMLVVVTFVSALVHIYSFGYMHDDPHVQRFMAYLSLFTFCMLMLVTSDNLVQLFFGWEGVGLCSYLLIGFWYKKQSACNAAIKAFVVNRVGDFGFALGIFTIYMIFNSIQFDSIFSNSAAFKDHHMEFLGYHVHTLTLICILLFIGCMGKSAQLGLHTWLPDAMEGPTPVSALIHAATMVTAGVFLVARCSPLFEYSPVALNVVTIVGATTAIFAATIAITQNDIKRIIAYSTCSQLGYMFFACGVSAYSAGVFHLMTHGFFKALLFLASGSVIHALSGEQDIRKMGGIWKKIPQTYILMFIGSLALAGIYPFAGYFSKDVILEAAYVKHSSIGNFAFVVGILTAFLTAFYSWRLIIMTFHGKTRCDHHTYEHIHESPKSILIPLYLLGVGSVVAGYIAYHYFGIVDASHKFWAGSIFVLEENNPLEKIHHLPEYIKFMPLIAGVAGIALSYLIYMFGGNIAERLKTIFKPLYIISYNKYFIDELYNYIFIRPAILFGRVFSLSDKAVIDGVGPDGATNTANRFAVIVNKMQTGLIYNYAFVMLFSVLVFISYIIFSMVR